MSKKLKDTFKLIEDTQEPENLDYIGNEKHVGRSKKEFSIFLDGETDDDELGVLRVKLVTPKNRKLMRFLTKVAEFENFGSDTIHDEILDYIIDNYGAARTLVDKLTTQSLFNLIKFTAYISGTPS